VVVDADKVLEELAAANEAVASAKQRYEEASAERSKLLLKATDKAGWSRNKIAQRLNLSVGRVQQLYKAAAAKRP
jgi:hypothetical protein